MKKSLLLLITSLGAILSFGQQEVVPVTFGVRAGINISNLTYSSNLNSSGATLIGLNAGVFATIHTASAFSIQPELAWSAIGNKPNGVSVAFETIQFTQVYHYLTLPVLGKYAITHSGLNVYAGPQVAYLWSAALKYQDEKQDIKEGYRHIDLAAIAGIEYELPHTPLSIAARYQLGLSNMMRNPMENASISNKVISCMVGFRF